MQRITKPCTRLIKRMLGNGFLPQMHGGFSPLSVAGLYAWVDPSDSSSVFQDALGVTPATNGDPVGRLTDKSGNGRHATQSDTTKKGTLSTINSRAAIQWDGVDDTISFGNLASGFSIEASIYLVAYVNQSGYNLFSSLEANSSWWRHASGVYISAWRSARVNGAIPTFMPTTGTHVFGLRCATDVYKMNLNGTDSIDLSPYTFERGDIYRFPYNEHATPFNGKHGELLLFNRCVSDVEQTQIVNYLTGKWL